MKAEPRSYAKDVAVRALALTLLWLGLSRGEGSLLVAGLVMVPAALYVSLRIKPTTPPRFRLTEFLRVLPRWLWRSFVGSLVVARSALWPGPVRLTSELRVIRLEVEHPPARLLLSAVVSMVPGTVCTDLRPDGVTVHLLDASRREAVLGEVRKVEAQVARIFGEPVR